MLRGGGLVGGGSTRSSPPPKKNRRKMYRVGGMQYFLVTSNAKNVMGLVDLTVKLDTHLTRMKIYYKHTNVHAKGWVGKVKLLEAISTLTTP